MSIYYQDDLVTLYHGDAVATLAEMGSGSVDCIVTSPPYFGLRDYGIDGQIGAEPSPAEFVEALVAVFREARRVLADDGTLWLNLGDSYSTGGSSRSNLAEWSAVNARGGAHRIREAQPGTRRPVRELAPKNLLGIPWRVSFALQDDGWILRNDIIWNKPNAMPESVRDRLSVRHEHIFLLTKSPHYHFDIDAIREKYAGDRDPSRRARSGHTNKANSATGAWSGAHDGRNPGDVWDIPTTPFPGAHFATFPAAIPERCILAGCRPGGTVLDPFSGSGTTGLAAAKHGRGYVGVDLNAEYLDLSLRTRLQQPALDFASLA